MNMIEYILVVGLLYLFLQFQLDKIRDPTHPNKRDPYTVWLKKLKESIN